MNKSLKQLMTGAALAVSLVSSAFAVPVISTNTAAFSIPDNTAAGVNSTISIADSGSVNSLSVQVAMETTWLGDLIVKLTHGANTIRLMDRPGRTVSGAGDSSNLSTSFPLTFSALASQTAELMGSGCDGIGVIGSTVGCTDTFFLPHESFSAFFGTSVTGDWILNVSDNAGADFARVASWTLNANVTQDVPEPTSLALMGLALAGLAAARRRKV